MLVGCSLINQLAIGDPIYGNPQMMIKMYHVGPFLSGYVSQPDVLGSRILVIFKFWHVRIYIYIHMMCHIHSVYIYTYDVSYP